MPTVKRYLLSSNLGINVKKVHTQVFIFGAVNLFYPQGYYLLPILVQIFSKFRVISQI